MIVLILEDGEALSVLQRLKFGNGMPATKNVKLVIDKLESKLKEQELGH